MHYEYKYRYYIQDHKDLSCRIYAIRPDIETITVLETHLRQRPTYYYIKSDRMIEPYTKAFETLDQLKHYLFITRRFPNIKLLTSVPKYCLVIKRDCMGELESWVAWECDDRYPYSMKFITNPTGGSRVGRVNNTMDNLLMQYMNNPHGTRTSYGFTDDLEELREWVLEEIDF